MQEETSFIGILKEVSIRPLSLEGVKGNHNEYYLTIEKENQSVITETIQILSHESEGETTVKGSILDEYMTNIKIDFPETKDLVYHKDILESLKNKLVRWIKKPLGKRYMDIPRKKYFIPTIIKKPLG